MKKNLLFLLSVLLLIACQVSFSIPQPPAPPLLSSTPTQVEPASPLEPSPTPVTNYPTLSLSSIENAQYHSALWGDFQLVDGIYYRTPAEPNASPQLYTTQFFGLIAYGDLNGDGAEDAAVILQTHNGGTGDVKEVAAVLNQNGQPYNISTFAIGSMVAVESLEIHGGEIRISGRTAGPNDALCCPSQFTAWQLHLQDNQLVASTSTESMPGISDTPAPAMSPSLANNFYGIPYESPTWLIKPRTGDHPYNILVLGADEKCSLTVNIKNDFRDLTVTTDQLILGQHTWQWIRTFQGEQQVDEIYVPDVYPPEYMETARSNGYGYYLGGLYDSCRLAVQGILAGVQ